MAANGHYGNGNETITLGGGGDTVTTGNGDQAITLGGSGSTVTLGNGSDTVHGGTGDTFHLANTTLNLFGTNEIVFIGTGNATINDFSTGLNLKIGPTAGNDILSRFASDPSGRDRSDRKHWWLHDHGRGSVGAEERRPWRDDTIVWPRIAGFCRRRAHRRCTRRISRSVEPVHKLPDYLTVTAVRQ